MRALITLSLILMSLSEGPAPYSCEELVATTTDDVTGKSVTKLIDPINAEGEHGDAIEIRLFRLPSSKVVYWDMELENANGCVDDQPQINILFTDGTRLELKANNDFNCDDDVMVYLARTGPRKKQLKEITAKTIDTLRVWTREGYVEASLSETQAEAFQAALQCLSTK